MKFKGIIALLIALIMVFALCACGGQKTPDSSTQGSTQGTTGGNTPASALEGTYNVKLWVAEKAVELTKSQIAKFNQTNTDGITINATVEPVSESEAATNMITDVEAGGDIFCFAQDQFARLVQAGALAQLGVAAAQTVTAANDAGVVAAAKSGDSLYAYPLTSDNGYFMYYDKSVIPAEHLDSLEALIADCEAANKFFAFEMQTSAWYLASFFFGTGCVSEWVTDDDGNYISVHDTFDSPEGLIAAKGMKKLVDSPMHLSASGGDNFASGAAIVVSGTWDYTTVSEILGDNFGATDLPSFTVDGKSYHLGSFNGCKLMGVKPQTDAKKQAVLHRLAQFLTNEDCQMERFNQLGWGPSNSNAQKSEAVQASPALAALLAQGPYSIPQGQIHGSWWDLAKVIGDDVKAATDEAGLQAALDNYKAKMEALFTMSEDEKTAWTVIGMYNNEDGFFFTDYSEGAPASWGDDLAMVKVSDGVWETESAWSMPEGTEFKVRQGKSWDNAFPAENFKVEEAGIYKIRFEEATGEITLIPSN